MSNHILHLTKICMSEQAARGAHANKHIVAHPQARAVAYH
jgi:hypothetical protein